MTSPQGTSFSSSTLLYLWSVRYLASLNTFYTSTLIHCDSYFDPITLFRLTHCSEVCSFVCTMITRRPSLPSRLRKPRLVRTVDLNSTLRLDVILAPKHSHLAQTTPARPTRPRGTVLNTTYPTCRNSSHPARTTSYNRSLLCKSSHSVERVPSWRRQVF